MLRKKLVSLFIILSFFAVNFINQNTKAKDPDGYYKEESAAKKAFNFSGNPAQNAELIARKTKDSLKDLPKDEENFTNFTNKSENIWLGNGINKEQLQNSFIRLLDGDDVFNGSASPSGFRLNGNTGKDNLLGSSEGDYLLGGQGDDYIDGASGDDILLGGQGNDYILGSTGDDVIFGGQGDDIISGEADNVFGEPSNDILFGDKGSNILLDTEGSNLFVFDINNATGVDQIYANRESFLDLPNAKSSDLVFKRPDDNPTALVIAFKDEQGNIKRDPATGQVLATWILNYFGSRGGADESPLTINCTDKQLQPFDIKTEVNITPNQEDIKQKHTVSPVIKSLDSAVKKK
jgi:Ca2+-binding RTX toxin-like protein